MTAAERKLVKQVKAEKADRQSSMLQYNDMSGLAFIVHSFNRAANIDRLVAGLRRLGDHEMIVCDDGSLDGSHEKWMTHLRRPNDFLLHSNDIHEIRILDRAIRFARAEIICLVQDDDRIPRGAGWLKRALDRFKAHPQLAIIGGFMGFRSFHPKPQKARRLWGQVPFEFVQHVNIGPYFIRKRHFEALGGWDHSFSQAGEPGICFDNELCLRAWLNGYQVGYSFVPFKGPAGHYSLDGGTVLFSGSTRRKNQLRNQKKIYAMYSKDVRLINRFVREANRSAGLL
ncbi:MAG TPA: glycosyltransferase [Thermoanaerobaculia bacterium]|nr:glycosyltransferase [Thermoanaerobaculia bacterium]